MTPAPGSPRVAFRVDASIEIGTGHVMRCLTLAAALSERGATCVFLCRPHEGHLMGFIAAQGFPALALPALSASSAKPVANDPSHAAWLGTGWTEDARDSLAALADHTGGAELDWLVVDHYALDARWEAALRPACKQLMVIDDLADRPHDCDLLLDQSLGREAENYAGLLPPAATTLLGPRYALLRPDFARLRTASLSRRVKPELRKLLVTMGGVDKDNATGKVLDALADCTLPDDVVITVVMGLQAPWLSEVRAQAAAMRLSTEVLVGVRDMAELMVQSDLAIGGAGMTAIERCVLGLPTIMVIQARNQIKQAEDLARIGAAVIYDPSEDHAGRDLASLVERISQTENYTDMSQAAAAVTRGEGLPQIAECIVSGDRERLEIDQLVPMTEVHLEQVLAWRNDPRVRQNMYSQHEISLAEHNDWWRAAKDRSDRRYYIFQTNGVDAGFVSITDIDRKNGTASWAFFSANTAPKGTGTRMERAALKMAFEELGLRKLCCEVLGFNSRVVAFHKRFGFRIEGTLAAHKLINGGYCDVILMAAFADDWRKTVTVNKSE